MNPKLTVYITNHNYGRYIRQAIESVLEQSFKDFELIIIDDGSTDCSHDIIREYETSNRIQVINQQNKGLVVSNNIALKLARGEYIMRLDADDYLDQRALEVMASTLDRDPEIALVFPDYYEVDEAGEIISQIRRHDFKKEVSLLDQPAHGACTMIRKEILSSLGGYDESFSRQDGYDIWLKVTNGHKVLNINLPLFYYRQHGKSLTKNEELLFDTRTRILEKHVKRSKPEKASILAIIPIRGTAVDARSIPLKMLGDKYLIDWTIDSVLDLEGLTGIIVNTPDANVIAHIKSKYGKVVYAFQRRVELARINEGLGNTLVETINHYEENHPRPDAIMVLNIESPFRSKMYLKQAIASMTAYDVDCVCAVRLDDDIFYLHDGKGLKPRKPENGLRLERDDLYRKVGGITLVKTNYLMAHKSMLGGRTGHIVLDQKSAFTIKSELDWKIAGLLAEEYIQQTTLSKEIT